MLVGCQEIGKVEPENSKDQSRNQAKSSATAFPGLNYFRNGMQAGNLCLNVLPCKQMSAHVDMSKIRILAICVSHIYYFSIPHPHKQAISQVPTPTPLPPGMQ